MRVRKLQLRHVVVRGVQEIPTASRPTPLPPRPPSRSHPRPPFRTNTNTDPATPQLAVHRVHQRVFLGISRRSLAPQHLRHILHPAARVSRSFLLGLNLPPPVNAARGACHHLYQVVGALAPPGLGQDRLDVSEAVGVSEPEDDSSVNLR